MDASHGFTFYTYTLIPCQNNGVTLKYDTL